MLKLQNNLKICVLFSLLTVSCVSLSPHSYFARMPESDASATRKLLVELKMHEHLVKELEKMGIEAKKLCAQKVIYKDKEYAQTMFELHGHPCNKKLGENALLTDRWDYALNDQSRFINSRFLVGEFEVGSSEPYSDTVTVICGIGAKVDKTNTACSFTKGESDSLSSIVFH